MLGAEVNISYPFQVMEMLRHNANYILADPSHRDSTLSSVKKVPRNGEGYRLDRVLKEINGFEAKFLEIQKDYSHIGRKQLSYNDLQDIIVEEGIFCGPMLFTDGIEPTALGGYSIGTPENRYRVYVYHPKLSLEERYFHVASFIGSYFLNPNPNDISQKKTTEANLFALNCAVPMDRLLKAHKQGKSLQEKLEVALNVKRHTFESLLPALKDVARLLNNTSLL